MIASSGKGWLVPAIVVVTILLTIGSLSLSLVGCGFCGQNHPSDEALIKRFERHEAEFEKLLEMFRHDRGLSRIGEGFTRPSDPATVGVSADRMGAYRDLLDRLGLPYGIEGDEDKSDVFFYASAAGLAVSGSGKGYAYLSSEPEILVDDLDDYWSEDGRSFTSFRSIQGRWYLFFDYED